MSVLSTEAQNVIALPAPDFGRQALTLMSSLNARRSIRAYSGRMLSMQDLSDLLWAAQGLTGKDGRMTSPTAKNSQEILLYVFMQDGVYIYDHYKHELSLVVKGDHRKLLCAGQAFAATAPVSLLMVADLGKYGADTEHARMMVCADAGICSENINLFCTSVRMCTVTRGMMDAKAIKDLLGLTDKQIPVLNNPVGYPEE